MHLRRLLTALLMILPLHPHDAPGQRPSPGGGDPGPLRGNWTLTRFVDAGGEHPPGEARVTLSFAADGAVSGSTGVNTYHGRYAADADGGLRWPLPFSLTGLYGPDAAMRLELIYMPALAHVTRWEILPAGPELRLSAADGKTALTFRRQANPPPTP